MRAGLHGRFTDKPIPWHPVRWQNISLKRWQDRNSVDKWILARRVISKSYCQWIVLKMKRPVTHGHPGRHSGAYFGWVWRGQLLPYLVWNTPRGEIFCKLNIRGRILMHTKVKKLTSRKLQKQCCTISYSDSLNRIYSNCSMDCSSNIQGFIRIHKNPYCCGPLIDSGNSCIAWQESMTENKHMF